jgi:hypothetical protein
MKGPCLAAGAVVAAGTAFAHQKFAGGEFIRGASALAAT